jgi:hypothetical protein
VTGSTPVQTVGNVVDVITPLSLPGVVVQRLEHRPVTAKVAGSNPVNPVLDIRLNVV